MPAHITHIVGVDEAGRGPLAGPVAIGVTCVPAVFDWDMLPGVADSKTLTHEKRALVFDEAVLLQKKKCLHFSVSLVSAQVIDRIGISRAVALGIERSFQKLSLDPSCCAVKLDGLLSAPPAFTTQQTIIRGDRTEKEIGLASIMAKVTRDRYMLRMAAREEFSPYAFGAHKGYGTKVHQTALREYGLSTLHRRTFCTRLA